MAVIHRLILVAVVHSVNILRIYAQMSAHNLTCVAAFPRGHLCYGIALPYESTSGNQPMDLWQDFRSWTEVFIQTEKARYFPNCWEAIQPVLCAIRYPRCENGRRYAPARLLCDRLVEVCQHGGLLDLPHVLRNCTDGKIFEQSSLIEMDFTMELLGLNFTEGICPETLTKTSDAHYFYPEIGRCGVRCQDHFLDEGALKSFQSVTLGLLIPCMLLNVFAVISLVLKMCSFKSSLFNPDKCVMMMSLSFLFSCCGYALQFFPELRDKATCTEEGLRQHIDRNASGAVRIAVCLVTFLLTYIFTLSGFIWFGHLMFACYLDFQRIINSHRSTKAAVFSLTRSSLIFFHGTAFILPTIVAIAVILLQSVEGNNLLGVCWISPLDYSMKTAFVLAPFSIVITISFIFIVLYWLNLRRSQLSQFGTLKTQHDVLQRLRLVGSLCVLILFSHILQLAGLYCVIYNEHSWRSKVKHFVHCQISSTTQQDAIECRSIISSATGAYVAAHYAMLVSYFMTGAIVSSWTWNSTNLRRWRTVLGGRKLQFDPPRKGAGSRESLKKLANAELAPLQDSTASRDSFLFPSFPNDGVLGPVSPELTSSYQRSSIFPGRKISSVADFTQQARIQNWQEEARFPKLARCKSMHTTQM